MGTLTYNTGFRTLNYIYRATSGGTSFSANEVASTAFDYFSDSAVVDDCLYIGSTDSRSFSDITFNIGTAIAGTGITIVWEFGESAVWSAMEHYEDDTNAFTTTGSQAMKFGGDFGWFRLKVVNGSSGAFWIRARITALTTITEGGANTTDVVTIADGNVNIDSYTDGSPCTLTDIKAYLDANAPWVDANKTINHYDFTHVNLWANSRLKVTNESFEIGRGWSSPGKGSMNYLEMGVKVDEYNAYNGGMLWIHAAPNSYPTTFSTTTKIYGSLVRSISSAGYPALNGEWIDSTLDGINFWPDNAGILKNCRIVNPGVWICASGFPTTFDRNSMLMTGSTGGYFYNTNITMRDLTYQFLYSSRRAFFFMYQTYQPKDFIVVNPSPALPGAVADNGVANSIVRRSIQGFTALDVVWYYDDSATSYTDYTTEFGNDTADNAPIHGDVDDIYYFGTTATKFSNVLTVVTNLASNDYVYYFEYYQGGAWREMTPMWDRTDNFTVDGETLYLSRPLSYSSLSINGTTAYYFRMTITTKGTGTPMITKLTNSGQTGVSNWNAYEKFTVDVNVTDKQAVAISGATVIISLDGTTTYQGTTDASGDMTQQDVTSRHWYFDPIKFNANYHQIGETVNNDYDITISMGGYETFTRKLVMDKKYELGIPLRQAISGGRDSMGDEFK